MAFHSKCICCIKKQYHHLIPFVVSLSMKLKADVVASEMELLVTVRNRSSTHLVIQM